MKYLVPFILLFVFYAPMFGQKDLAQLSYEELKQEIEIILDEGTYKKGVPICKMGMQRSEKEFGKADSLYLDYAFSLGACYLNLGKFDLAEVLMLETKELSLAYYGKNHTKYAFLLSQLGYLYSESSKLSEGEQLYKEAARIYRNNQITSGEAYASLLNNIANLEQRRGNYKKAERLFIELEKIDREAYGEQHENYAITLNNMALLYRQMEQFEKTEALYDKALQILKGALGEKNPNYATTLSNLAFLKEQIGKLDEAEILSLKVIELDAVTLGKDHPVYGRSLNNLAALYVKMKRYKEAERLYLEAKGIWEKTIGKKHNLYNNLMSNMALMYSRLDRIEEAKVIYEEVLQNDKEYYGTKHIHYAHSLMNLAEINVRGIPYEGHVSAYNETVRLFDESLTIIKKVVGDNHTDYAVALLRYAFLCNKMDEKQKDKTERLFLRVKKIYAMAYDESHPKYVAALDHLVKFYYKYRDLEKAYQYSIASFAATSKNFEDYFPNVFANDLTNNGFDYNPAACCSEIKRTDFLNLSKLEFKDPNLLGDLFKSLILVTNLQYQQLMKDGAKETAQIKLQAHYNITKAALEVNEWVRNNYAEKGDKLRALKENTFLVNKGIKAALALRTKESIEEAFGFAEKNKSILLGDALKGNRARVLGDLPDSMALKEIALATKKEKLQKKKYLAQTEEEKLAAIAKENSLMKEYGAFVQSLKDKYPKYHALKYEKIRIKAAEIQELLEDEHTLLLEYLVGNDATYLFAISKTVFDLIPITISKNRLTDQIRQLRKALSDYKFIIGENDASYQKYVTIASWFYQELLQPVLKNKSIKNLIIVSDGELAHLPFEIFLSESVEGQKKSYAKLPYLIKDYNVSYDYSAMLWKENRKKQTIAPNIASFKKGEMLACAATYPNNEDWKKLEQENNNWKTLRPAHVYKLRKSLGPLLAAEKEVNELSESFSGVFLQKNAANERFFKEHAKEYSIIHLAMHGHLHPRIPMLSSLAFTENKDSLEDNFLQAYEIARLQLNTDLVVLSACETGYGIFQEGEGVLSLARSFMYAGTPSLVVSLWQVNDESTALIMNRFYNNLRNGLPKDQALRQAKLAYLQKASGIASHPAFWSAFIQLGDNRPIQMKRKSNKWLWYGVGALILIGLAIGNIKRKKIA